MKVIKNIFLVFILIIIIAFSFWISFLLGKNILNPVVKEPETIDSLTKEASEILEEIGPISFEVETEPFDASLNDYNEGSNESVTFDTISTSTTSKLTNNSNSGNVSVSKVVSPSYKYKVQIGVFSAYKNAVDLKDLLLRNEFNPEIEKYRYYFRVFLHATDRADAKRLLSHLKNKGFEAIIKSD